MFPWLSSGPRDTATTVPTEHKSDDVPPPEDVPIQQPPAAEKVKEKIDTRYNRYADDEPFTSDYSSSYDGSDNADSLPDEPQKADVVPPSADSVAASGDNSQSVEPPMSTGSSSTKHPEPHEGSAEDDQYGDDTVLAWQLARAETAKGCNPSKLTGVDEDDNAVKLQHDELEFYKGFVVTKPTKDEPSSTSSTKGGDSSSTAQGQSASADATSSSSSSTKHPFQMPAPDDNTGLAREAALEECSSGDDPIERQRAELEFYENNKKK